MAQRMSAMENVLCVPEKNMYSIVQWSVLESC